VSRIQRNRKLAVAFMGAPMALMMLLAVMGTLLGGLLRAAPASAVPVPVPVYEIEAVSGTHHASLLNLPVGQPGVIQAPMPVDVDGDLVPDVLVAVNLINVDGLFFNPPQIGQFIAPNIQINRLITAPVLGQSSPPLRINIKMIIKDVGGSQPDMIFRFGYDTGAGGTIPQFWKATVAGLDKMFNPIQAVIDTTGQQLGLHPGIEEFRLGPIAAPYQGPLSIIGGFQQGSTNANIDLNYRPFPNAVQVTYGTDSQGQHITYSHGVDTEVDVTSKLSLTTPTQTVNGVARVDRMPRAIALDLNQTDTGGTVDYHSKPNARLPDVQVDLTTTTTGKPPLVARADIEQLPAVMHGEWNINAASKQAHAKFTASGTGIGAIEAKIANYLGNPTKLVPWIPDQRQYASFQQVPITGGTEQLIIGRAERLRDISFDQVGGGYKAHAGIGDGEVPFVGHIGIDQRPTGPLIEGRAQIAPLPDSMDMSFTPPGANQLTDPLKVVYDASKSIDVDAHFELRQPTAVANAVCGAAGTVCADFQGRTIPKHIEARVRNGLTTPEGNPESRIEVDHGLPTDPPGNQPDFRADVALGPQGPADVAPLFAHAELDGLSRYLRLRMVQGADETLQRLEFHTCDYNYTTRTCATGTEDEIGAIRAAVRDWITRPANLPQPVSPAPNFIGVAARGDDANANLVNFEAIARIVHIKEVQYANSGGLFGARARIGGGGNLAVDADIKGIRLPAILPAGQRIDLAAKALVYPLPDEINICFQNSGGPLVAGTDPLTQACQEAQPFEDQTLTKSPIVFDWHASSPFSTIASARIHLDKATPTLADDVVAAANLKIENIPTFLTAKVNVPTGDSSGPVRVLTVGPPASSINLGLHGEFGVGGASCNDPDPAHDIACADATVTQLPTNLSALFDSTKNATRVEFHACNYLFFDPSPSCKSGTAGEIGVLAVDGHLVKGHPGPLGVLEPTTDQHAFLQYRQPGPNDIALRGRARFEKIRSVFYKQSNDGFDAGYDMGTGLKPLEMKVQADTRTGSLPDVLGLLAAAELLITNLPSKITVRQHGPGDGPNSDPMVLTYDASAPIRVQAHAQVFRAAAGANAACGDEATACATLDLKRVPSHAEVTVGQSETMPASAGAPIDHHTKVDFESNSPIGAKPDLIVDAVVGLPSTTPVVGHVPIRAHAELLGLPRYVTMHMDEHVTNPGQTNEQRDLQKVSIRTCKLNNSDACTAGTEDQLDSLFVEAQNFLVRPLDFPAPNHGITEPLWATVAARAKLFQAAVNLLHIREATYVNHLAQSAKGFRVRVGDNQNLQARVDIKNFPLGNLNVGDLPIQSATADVLADLLIKPLPDDIRICMRESNKALVAPSGDVITDPCENNTPFNNIGQPDHTPMSFAYRASVPINQIKVNVDAALNGLSTAVGNPPIEARRLHGELTLDNIPEEITAHILTPADDVNGNAKGPLRVQYDAPGAGPGINVHFRAHQTQGDSICQDPRPSATAMCVGADLINLPKHLYLRYEPDKLSDNFHAETDSDTGKMDFKNLELSSVKPKLDNTGARIPGKADVLVATGEILGIDDQIVVDGNINMPHDPNKAGSIDLTASIRIDAINAVVRNYIAPDPFTAAIPARPVYKDNVNSPANLNSFTVRARPLPDGSPIFKAEASIKNVAGFGFHQIADNAGEPTGTNVVNIDFAKDFAARAFADIVLADATHIRGDVLLEHIPAGLQFCFRGARPTNPTAAAGQPVTFCDDNTATTPQDGAFQFLGTPANPGLTGLDVDAFLRAAAPGGTDIVSGRINITGIPYRVDGILPSEHNGGKLDVQGKNHDGDPLGIKQIKFNVASFDFPSGTSSDLQSGYTSSAPGFVPLTNQSSPFPPPTPTTEYTSAVAEGDPAGSFDFQAVGRLGDADDSVSSSRLQRIYSSATACANRDNRPDFPLLPTNDGVSTYRCIGADLQQTNPSVKDPFALSAVYKTADGNIVQLRDAGINDLPPFFQVDIAKTKLSDGPNNALRRRCGSVASETTLYNNTHNPDITQSQAAATVVDCMPPLVRFDQPLSDAFLFGVGEFGKPEDLATLAGTNPVEALANLNDLPRGDGWGATTGNSDELKGIRAKAITVDPDAAVDNDERTAARVSFRLPIPQSVTVDQVQSESVHKESDADHFFDGSDMRFHYVVRDAAGNTIGNLGELSAMYQAGDGSQVLLSRPCRANPHERVSNTSLFGNFTIDTPLDCNTDYVHGLLIPGEIGISMYNRTNRGTGQKYIQIDGRLSTDESAAVRLIGNSQSVGRIEAEIKNIPGPNDKNGNPDPNVGPDDATFRVAFLMKGEKETPPTGTPPTPPAPPSECVLCITTNVFLAQAFVSFNFWPDTTKAKARLVEATLNHDGAKNGLETHSFNAIKSGGPVAQTNAAIEADAYLLVNPLNIYGYLNLAPTLKNLGHQAVQWVVDALDLPGWVEDILDLVVDVIADLLASLVNLDFTVESRLDASLEWRTSHATMRQNLLHVKMINSGSASDGSGDTTLGPIDWYVHQLKLNANLGITIHTPWPFPDINIGLTFLTLYYIPVGDFIVPFLFKYLKCSGSFWDLVTTDLGPALPGDTISAGPGETDNVVIWPLWEPRLILGGLIGNLINSVPQLRNLGGLFFCIPGADDGDIPLGAPGDTFNTVSGGLWPQHPIFNSDALADSALTPGAPAGIDPPPADPPPPLDCNQVPTPVGCPPPPPPPVNGPDYTVFAGTTLAMCGLHAFGDLTIQAGAPGGTIAIATAADPANPTGTGANCAAADVGKLVITTDTLTNHGVIDGNLTQPTQPSVGTPPVATTSATGNAGAGHGGAGGAGTPGTGGPAYSLTGNANAEKNQATSEVGAPGAATSGSRPKGGGLIQLLANDSIVSDGTIRSDGDNGVANTTGACAVDGPDYIDNAPTGGPRGPEDPLVHHANTGVAAPAGAGSGGGIVLSAPTVDVRGTTASEMHANGGNGADSKKGSSGGGGGGVVKMLGPILLFDAGFTPAVTGGSAGANQCSGDGESSAGGAGGSGVNIAVATPTAQAGNPASFWNNGSSVTVPFQAKAAYQNAGGYDVVLCGLHSTITTAPASGNLADRFTVPGSNSPTNPCGAGASQLATKTIPSGVANAELEFGDALATITFSRPNVADNGIWGLYAIAVRPTNNCAGAAPTCAVSRLPQPQFDPSTNTTNPARVETVLGIDNSNPTVSITAPPAGFLTKSVAVTFSFDPQDQDTPTNQALSHVVKTECRNTAPVVTQFVNCASGASFNLVPGNGAKTIQVRVTDGAGNTATASRSGILSNSPPTATATIQFAPNGSNGWYTPNVAPGNAPTITINGYSQGDGVPAEASSSASTGPFRYRFDNLPEEVCTAAPCTVPASYISGLPAGTHQFHFAAVDALGNRLYGTAMQVMTPIKWDPDKPTSELDTVPAAPNVTVSGNGWFTTKPFVVVSALDALGGAGLNEVKYRIDGIGAFQNYVVTSPPQLSNGIHSVEFFSTDLAGNVELTKTVDNLRVDDAAPDSTLTKAPAAPNGLAGWYVGTVPTVSVGGFDDHGGTGAPTTGMLTYRVDNGNDILCNAPCNVAPSLLGTGQHLVGVRATDAAGNVHVEGGEIIKVDVDAPRTTVSMRSPNPDGLNSWYLSRPYIVLDATDQPADYGHVLPYGSGIAAKQFQFDGVGPFLPYIGPIQVVGEHSFCARSIDVAGNVETPVCLPAVKGDDADPTTAISVAGTLGGAGWYVSSAVVTLTSNDPSPGSGLTEIGAIGTPCYDVPGTHPAAGTCVSVDGRPFVPYLAPLTLNEGVHYIQAYSIDAAGRRSVSDVRSVFVDKSPPVTTARTLPPYSARNGWFRAVPRVILRAADGDQNSGVLQTFYKIGSGAYVPYTGPFDIPNTSLTTVSFYSVDAAGLQETPKTIDFKVDTIPPIALATNPEPALWLQILNILGNLLGLSPAQAKLHWTIGDSLSSKATVRVIIYDVTGNVVRQLDGGAADNGSQVCSPTCTITPGVNLNGYTAWDGKDLSLTGIVGVGLYFYRVVVTDDAGNVAQSGESKPIQIKASLGIL